VAHTRILRPLEKAFKVYAALALAIVVFQIIGLLMYISNAWPPSGAQPSRTVTLVAILAVLVGFFRSSLWICIYWIGARVFSLLSKGNDCSLDERIQPSLATLTRLLIASCVMDILFLPAFFLSDSFLPFSISGWRLGFVEVARIVFPQAFGFAALILAFLTSQYGELIRERSRMKSELALTI
jgi:hypothetical protein